MATSESVWALGTPNFTLACFQAKCSLTGRVPVAVMRCARNEQCNSSKPWTVKDPKFQRGIYCVGAYPNIFCQPFMRIIKNRSFLNDKNIVTYSTDFHLASKQSSNKMLTCVFTVSLHCFSRLRNSNSNLPVRTSSFTGWSWGWTFSAFWYPLQQSRHTGSIL